MSLLTKILIGVNLVAAVGFLYFMAKANAPRQQGPYAALRWDLALDGLPVDEKDSYPDGRPKHLDLNEQLLRELRLDPSVQTQEDYLQRRKSEIDQRITDAQVPGTEVQKLARVLMAIAPTAERRNELFDIAADKAPPADTASKLREKLEKQFAEARQGTADKKRQQIAYLLVSLMDVLPTQEELQQRQQQEQPQPGGQPPDPTAAPSFRQVLNVVGLKQMAEALDTRASEMADIQYALAEDRDQQRLAFANEHQGIIDGLMSSENDLRELQDLLAQVQEQERVQEDRAKAQKAKVMQITKELGTAQQATAAQLERLEKELEKLFRTRKELRDINRRLQGLEQRVRELEKKAS